MPITNFRELEYKRKIINDYNYLCNHSNSISRLYCLYNLITSIIKYVADKLIINNDDTPVIELSLEYLLEDKLLGSIITESIFHKSVEICEINKRIIVNSDDIILSLYHMDYQNNIMTWFAYRKSNTHSYKDICEIVKNIKNKNHV